MRELAAGCQGASPPSRDGRRAYNAGRGRPSKVMMSFPLRALLSLTALAGCIRGMDVRTAVTAPDTNPIAGASVLMDCPQVFKGSGRSLLGTTDARGELHHHEHRFGRWIHEGCDLVVEKPGFAPRRYAVEDVCREYDLNHCVRVDLRVQLALQTIESTNGSACQCHCGGGGGGGGSMR